MKKKISLCLYSGVVNGTFIGLVMSIAFSYVSASGRYSPAPTIFMNHFEHSATAMLVSILLWTCIGLVFSFSSLIFEATDWSILRMTITHFLIAYIGFLPLAILAGWFPLKFNNIFIFTVIYIVIYIIMWLVFMNIARKEVTSINKKIQRRNKK